MRPMVQHRSLRQAPTVGAILTYRWSWSFYTLHAPRRRENCEIIRAELTLSTPHDPKRPPAPHEHDSCVKPYDMRERPPPRPPPARLQRSVCATRTPTPTRTGPIALAHKIGSRPNNCHTSSHELIIRLLCARITAEEHTPLRSVRDDMLTLPGGVHRQLTCTAHRCESWR